MMDASSFLLFISIRWLDAIDILLVAILLYQLYKLVKGTVAIRIFIGILSIYLIWKLVSALQMDLLSEILGQFIGVGVLALIIVFQQEIRRFLILVGTQGSFAGPTFLKKLINWSGKEGDVQELNVNAIIKACFSMSKSRTGALIIVSMDSELRYQASSGETIDAALNAHLLESIFFKNSPLHDGAVIIFENKIHAARCILPLTENEEIPAQFGLRHRAAVGISENSTALAIIVSEETGSISTAQGGELKSNVSTEQLGLILKELSQS